MLINSFNQNQYNNKQQPAFGKSAIVAVVEARLQQAEAKNSLSEVIRPSEEQVRKFLALNLEANSKRLDALQKVQDSVNNEKHPVIRFFKKTGKALLRML